MDCTQTKNYVEPTITVEDPGKTLGLVSMIAGFVALGGRVIPFISGLTLPAAIVAVICGIMGKKSSAKVGLENSNAKIGLVCGIAGLIMDALGILLAIVIVVLYFVMFVGMGIGIPLLTQFG